METNRTIGDRYSILGLLGSGGMADVYLAYDELLARHVAVKVLKESYASDEWFRERFRQEAKNAARLSHPNIVAVYDRGEAREEEEDDRGLDRTVAAAAPYIVMEHVAGETLAEKLKREKSLDPAQAARVASAVAWALSEAHGRGIVHRDIKPHNIFLQGSSANFAGVKVGDFGIARALDSPIGPHGEALAWDSGEETTTIMGTAHYISPEQAQGRPVGPASDLYSLGATLYEMLVGRPPFGPTGFAGYPHDWHPAKDVVIRHATETSLSPHSVDEAIPEEISALTMRLLSKDPASRTIPGMEASRTSAVALELEHLAKSLAGHATPVPTHHVSKGDGDNPSSGDAATLHLGPGLPGGQEEAKGRHGGGGRRRRGIIAAGAASLLFLLLAGPLAAAFGISGNPLLSLSEREAGREEEPPPGFAGSLIDPPQPEATTEETTAVEETTTAAEETTSAEKETTSAEKSKTREEVEGAVRNYYEAVDVRNFAYTYDNLTSASRALFSSEDEWVNKNRLIAESEGLKLYSIEIELLGEVPSTSSGVPTGTRAPVAVDRSFANGSSIFRETVFIYEDGAWRHELSEEEIAIFSPGTPFEEPAEDTVPSAKTPEKTSAETSKKQAEASEEQAVKAAVHGHYEAIGRQNFHAAYSYFGPSFRSSTDERRWVAEEESYQITGATIHSVRVDTVSNNTATATVDVSFEDRTGSPRFSISWQLVKEGGQWKLDEQTSATR